jgi:uncharacterized protein
MKIIAAGDIHLSTHFFKHVGDTVAADLLILNGDLTNFGGVDDARKIIEAASSAAPSVVAQFGNLDQPEVNDFLEEAGSNLHNQARLIDEALCLIGVGGSNITPFSTPSEFSEKTLARCAEHGYRQAQELCSAANVLEKKTIPLILVSHTPPLNTRVDRLASGRPVGSSAIREFISQRQPDLCICGHIHEAAGSDIIGRTPIYNPGMLGAGGWLEIDIINSTVSVTFHDPL